MDMLKDGDLLLEHYCKNAENGIFCVPVATVEEAVNVEKALQRYDTHCDPYAESVCDLKVFRGGCLVSWKGWDDTVPFEDYL